MIGKNAYNARNSSIYILCLARTNISHHIYKFIQKQIDAKSQLKAFNAIKIQAHKFGLNNDTGGWQLIIEVEIRTRSMVK